MNIEEILQETLTNLLEKMQISYDKTSVQEGENNNYFINISSNEPGELIGYHGNNIQAIQHILKAIAWKKAGRSDFNILLDVDEYRKRQEENIINLAQRKIATVRKTGRPQELPPMNPYLRRKIHLMCMEPGMNDIETESKNMGEQRQIIIKLKK